jgi:hypothetical protein
VDSPGPDNELDQLLDGALASYSAQRPRPGLDGRIMRRITEAEQNPGHWRGWSIAWVSVVGAGVIAIVLADSSRQSASSPERVASVVAPRHMDERSTERAEHVSKRGTGRTRRAGGVRNSAPRQAMFPAPAPLTREEAALVRLAAFAPEVLHGAADAHQQRKEQVSIEPIAIPPLSFSGDSMEE